MVNRIKEGLFVCIVLVTALAFFYRDVVFGGHTFLVEASTYGTMPQSANGLHGPYGYSGPIDSYIADPTSLSSGSEPASRFIAISYQSGQIPLWNPHEGLGTPFYASGQVGVFDPIRLITMTFMPMAWWPLAVDFHLLLRYFLGGLFTYLFLRSLSIRVIPSLAAGVAFMFCTYFVMYGNIAHVPVELLYPLILWAYHKLATKRSSVAFLLCVFSVFLLVLSDFPELYVLHLGLGLTWYIFQAIFVVRNTPEKWRTVWIMALRFLSATILGLMLGAFVLLPFTQLLLSAISNHSVSEIVHYPIRDVLHQAVVISPGQFGRLTLTPLLLVAVGLLFAFCAELDKRAKNILVQMLVMVGIAVFFFLVAYNFPGFGLLARLPVINMIILSKYIQPILALLLVCAGGIGLDLLLTAHPKLWVEGIVFRGSRIAIVGSLTFSVLRLNMPLYQTVVETLVFDSAVVLAFLIGLALIKKTTLHSVGMFFVALIIVEQAVLNGLLEQRPVRYDPFTVPPFVSYLQQQPKPFRLVADYQILYPQQSSPYGLDDARYQEALNPPQYVAYCKDFLLDPSLANDTNACTNVYRPMSWLYKSGLNLLNVKYIVTTFQKLPSRNVPGRPLELVYSSDGINVFLNPNALPRAFVVHDAAVVSNQSDLLERLGSKDFDPARTVLLEETPQKERTNAPVATKFVLQNVNVAAHPDGHESDASSASEAQSAQVVLRNNNDMIVHTTLSTPGYLVVSELYYPGWEAAIDGTPAHIYSADGMLRAVMLGPGEHTVEFHFRPTVFFVGLMLSMLSLLITMAGVFLGKRHLLT